MKEVSVGVAGTAKNSGKTTTLVTLLGKLKKENIAAVGLTGIGYDGESFDNVTGLPKPRVDVYEGMIVAVTEKCVKYARAKIEPLLQTDIRTALGRIVIGKVTEAGKLVLAGPVKKSDLRKTLNFMRDCGAELVFVDGALGRVAPFAEVDGLILATGASRNSNISELALENEHLIKLLRRPVMAEKGVTTRIGSVLSEESFSAFLDSFAVADTIIVEGLLSGRFLGAITKNKELCGRLRGKRLLFDSSFKLLLAGKINETWDAIGEMERDLEIGVLKPAHVVSVTVNPYYPKYRYTTRDYEAAYVDKAALRGAIGNSMSLPCYDVVAGGVNELYMDVLNYYNRQRMEAL